MDCVHISRVISLTQLQNKLDSKERERESVFVIRQQFDIDFSIYNIFIEEFDQLICGHLPLHAVLE